MMTFAGLSIVSWIGALAAMVGGVMTWRLVMPYGTGPVGDRPLQLHDRQVVVALALVNGGIALLLVGLLL